MRTRRKSSANRRSSGNIAGISPEVIGKRCIEANSCISTGMGKQENSLRRCEYVATSEGGLKLNEKQYEDTKDRPSASGLGGCNTDALGNALRVEKDNERSFLQNFPGSGEEMYDSDWEDGSTPIFNPTDNNNAEDHIKGLTIELGEFTDSTKRKPIRRASAEDKGLAELVHKAHLLCLLARGRVIDSACDDPLIQASLLSLLPKHLLRISECAKLTANALIPLVNWLYNNFHVRSPTDTEKPFHSALAFALKTHEGTSEEVAALSVALFRALKLTTRFVCIMDVASLKSGADKSESSSQDANRMGGGIFNTSTLMVPRDISVSPAKSFSCDEKDNVHETSLRACKSKRNHSMNDSNKSKDSPTTLHNSHGSKRKGDLEFEMQLEMAICSTAVASRESEIEPHVKGLNNDSTKFPSQKRLKTSNIEEFTTSSHGFSTAIGSRKVGSPLYWAEVYCSGENLTGKWVHVDAVNGIVDGEQKVEAAAAACKTFLRYVVAFAGHGAKDVTRRYCREWYKIAPQRINSIWWNVVLAPLKELEAGATGGMVHLDTTQNGLPGQANMPEKTDKEVPKDHGKNTDRTASATNAFVATRNSLEDMELETRALTEPLPTNQQAYKNHQLYALERWLTKYQMLHPKGPILGLCSGHPVYPRTCVQTLKTKDRWLREGLQVKANELPAKVLKHHIKPSKLQVSDCDDYGSGDSEGLIELYGKWQLEPLCLPHAINGIVPKNERGQVDVWCEKSLPPATVHIRLPKVWSVAKRLGIDYAPAMVGFEFRNGRSNPVFDGIVVCAEFKYAILEAFAEENERREAEEKKRNERLAISRWYQLLSSIIIRQRLDSCYKDNFSSQPCSSIKTSNKSNTEIAEVSGTFKHKQSDQSQHRNTQKTPLNAPSIVPKEDNHEHVFLADDQSFDDEKSILTKRCRCGFSVQSEVL